MKDERQKKEKTRRETTAIKVWVTPAEKAAITVKADGYSLSASTYLRELALRSTRPPTRPGEKINHRGKRTDLQRVRTRRASKSRGSGICDHRAWRRRTTCGINRLKVSVAALLQPAILQPPTFWRSP